MVGVAFERHDTAAACRDLQSVSDDDARQSLLLHVKYQRVEPSFTEIIMYSFCYIGLLTGNSHHVMCITLSCLFLSPMSSATCQSKLVWLF